MNPLPEWVDQTKADKYKGYKLEEVNVLCERGSYSFGRHCLLRTCGLAPGIGVHGKASGAALRIRVSQLIPLNNSGPGRFGDTGVLK